MNTPTPPQEAAPIEWPLKNGTRVHTPNLSDKQLQQALDLGMSLAARYFREKGRECLTVPRGGTGMSFLADIKNAAYRQMANDRRQLLRKMYADPRYAEVIREAHARIIRHHALLKARQPGSSTDAGAPG
jgi:hypothetical protein